MYVIKLIKAKGNFSDKAYIYTYVIIIVYLMQCNHIVFQSNILIVVANSRTGIMRGHPFEDAKALDVISDLLLGYRSCMPAIMKS